MSSSRESSHGEDGAVPASVADPSYALRVASGDPTAEIFVLDSAFGLLQRAIGELDTRLKPGIYKVKVRSARDAVERNVLLSEDRVVDVTAEVRLPAAAPLDGSSRTHEYHERAAAAESARVHVGVGRGAILFLMARTWSGPAGDRQGLRRLVTEPPAQDDHRRRPAAGQAAADRLDADHLG